MNEYMKQLASRAHIKIRNRFTGFFAAEGTIKWELKAEHCTHRGHFFTGENADNLDCLIQEALAEMIKIERRYENLKSALSIIHPDRSEYDISQLARDEL